jgi:hypothetical protein
LRAAVEVVGPGVTRALVAVVVVKLRRRKQLLVQHLKSPLAQVVLLAHFLRDVVVLVEIPVCQQLLH